MTSLNSYLTLLIILLILSAFFSGSESAIFSLSNLEKRRIKIQHPRLWNIISELLERPRRTLVTILIGNMVVNTLIVVLATHVAIEMFGMQGVGWTIAIFTMVLLVFSEITPKAYAVRHNVGFASFSCIPLNLFAKFIFPIRWLVRWIADQILSMLVQEKKSDADLISEDELKTLVRIGEEEGALKGEEGEMIQRLIGLGGRIVREIMTPRTDMISFNLEDGPHKFIELSKQYHFTYFPIYEKSIDNLLGVISTQDFILSDRKKIRDFIIPPFYIPETKPVDELLIEFQKRRHRCALCIDEYGGASGLVTLEDVLEEIFGEFYDEYSKEGPLIKELGDNRYLVPGVIGLHELDEELNIKLHSETSETLSGWLLEQLGRIPNVNESFTSSGMEFYIREMKKQRIQRVEIKVKL